MSRMLAVRLSTKTTRVEKLAYKINKEDFAVYVYFDVKLPAGSASKD